MLLLQENLLRLPTATNLKILKEYLQALAATNTSKIFSMTKIKFTDTE
jgi:hypothetical protein